MTQRDGGRWLVWYAVIVAALVVILDSTLMGLIAPPVAADLGADMAASGLLEASSPLMMAALILGGGAVLAFIAFGTNRSRAVCPDIAGEPTAIHSQRDVS